MAKIKPTPQDFADADRDAGGPLPANPTTKQRADRYRTAQAIALMKAAGYQHIGGGQYELKLRAKGAKLRAMRVARSTAQPGPAPLTK